MALTVTFLKPTASYGPDRRVVAEVTFDSSYAGSGGESLTPAMLGLSEIFYLDAQAKTSTEARLLFRYDKTAQKLGAYFPSGGAGTAPTTIIDPTATVPSGSTAVTSSSATPAMTVVGGRGVEVGATADLSLYLVEIFAIGA